MEYWGELKSENFLEKNSFPVARRALAKKKSDVLKSIKKVKAPFVMKVSGKNLVHKNKLNGIKTDITSYSNTLLAFKELKSIYGASGVLFQQKLDGHEFLLGIKKTPEFGHTIVVGEGGIKTEIKKDIAFRVCPLKKEDATEMIKEIKFSKNINKKDLDAVEKIILKLCSLTQKFPTIKELDINPLIVNDGKATIVDSRIIWE